MVLVDTSVWVDHLRRGNPGLVDQLDKAAVLCHPFVVGELACGNLTNRTEILRLLQALPCAPLAQQQEVLHLLDKERLFGHGLGWVDIHLLASARLMKCPLWTLDKALSTAVEEFDLGFELKR
jgi:predicted nucleic acid-binding protein